MTNTESRPADVTELWRMLDLITPMALRVAATLRIADLISAVTPTTVGVHLIEFSRRKLS